MKESPWLNALSPILICPSQPQQKLSSYGSNVGGQKVEALAAVVVVVAVDVAVPDIAIETVDASTEIVIQSQNTNRGIHQLRIVVVVAAAVVGSAEGNY